MDKVMNKVATDHQIEVCKQAAMARYAEYGITPKLANLLYVTGISKHAQYRPRTGEVNVDFMKPYKGGYLNPVNWGFTLGEMMSAMPDVGQGYGDAYDKGGIAGPGGVLQHVTDVAFKPVGRGVRDAFVGPPEPPDPTLLEKYPWLLPTGVGVGIGGIGLAAYLAERRRRKEEEAKRKKLGQKQRGK